MQGLAPLLNSVARHRVGPNVLVMVAVLAGLWATTRLSTRFFPEFTTNTVTTSVAHSGVAPRDIEQSVVIPLENALRDLPELESIRSYSQEGRGRVILEFPDGTDMQKAVRDIKNEITGVTLPADADPPRTSLHTRSEDVLVLTIHGDSYSELYDIARRLEGDLNAQGVARLQIDGIPVQEIQVLVDQQRLIELGLTLEQVGVAVRSQNQSVSIGTIDNLGAQRRLTTGSEVSEAQQLYQIPVASSPQQGTTYLRDIAVIRQVTADNQVQVRFDGRPAVRIQLVNSGADIITTAGQLSQWLDRVRPTIPASIGLVFHDEDWQAVDSRLQLLLDNGASGILVVLVVLFFFLSLPVAFWVAAGIPVAMLGTLFIFQLAGGTINMISMFALIMAVGIVVDDAIVVGENAQHRLERGAPPMRAVTAAARTMFPPVLASTFTTISAFLPLFLVSGSIGAIIFDIPLIIVCVLIASLIECFLILPGHLYSSFARRKRRQPSRLRAALDSGFASFRSKVFRPLVTFAVDHSLATIAACVMTLAIAVSMLQSGFISYRFFPGSEGSKVSATVEFASGTSRERMADYVDGMLAALDQAEQQAAGGQPLVEHVTAMYGAGGSAGNADANARIIVELVQPDEREVTTAQFSRIWRKMIGSEPPGLEKLTIRRSRGGPPGQDIEITMAGSDIDVLKAAAQEIRQALAQLPGLSSISDDTPYGKNQYVFELTPLGASLGLDIASVARQLRFAIDGFKVQTFTAGVDEVDLKVLYASEPDRDLLGQIYIRTPTGQFVLLDDVVVWSQRQGFDTILHQNGRAAVTVTADLDDNASLTVDEVIASLQQQLLPQLASAHGIDFSFEGRQSQQRDAARDMQVGLAIAVVLIFIILTWVFNSWTLPLVVMATMPLGVIGTLIGHWVMGLTMSILSFFGMFTLMGIIVNNAIVLMRSFQQQAPDTDSRAGYNQAIVEAACLRLRPVLLTSLTTIGGLLPLMFETSRQAQFLIPMAASIVFGLAFATVLILLFTPACIAMHGSILRGVRALAAVQLPLGRQRG